MYGYFFCSETRADFGCILAAVDKRNNGNKIGVKHVHCTHASANAQAQAPVLAAHLHLHTAGNDMKDTIHCTMICVATN